VEVRKDKPDFIVVGAMKSGTTSLGFHLRNHRKVCFPRDELHFFDNEEHFSKGVAWYLKQFGRDFDDETFVMGEKTPTYSYHSDAPRRIHGLFPDVKLVWVFRNPVDRAYSNYLHALCNGGDNLGFEEAIDSESERIRDNIFFGYVERGRYYKQLERYLEYFSRDQMYFVLFEEFVSDAPKELSGLFEFIGLTDEGFEYVDETKNKTVIPRWPNSVWFARRHFGRGSIWRFVKRVNVWNKEPGYPELSRRVRERLMETYRDDNQRLEESIGKDLSVWEQE
jgi:hypothetical protein